MKKENEIDTPKTTMTELNHESNRVQRAKLIKSVNTLKSMVIVSLIISSITLAFTAGSSGSTHGKLTTITKQLETLKWRTSRLLWPKQKGSKKTIKKCKNHLITNVDKKTFSLRICPNKK